MTPVIWKSSLKGSTSELLSFCSVAVPVGTVGMQGLIDSAEKTENIFANLSKIRNSKEAKISTYS